MIVDGKAIAAQLITQTRTEAQALASYGVPTLAIITCDPTFETKKYLALKERKAVAAGVQVLVQELPPDATTAMVVASVTSAVLTAQAVVVQLPLPAHIDRDTVLAAVPATHDPDGFRYGGDPVACQSPVVVAIAEIARAYGVTFAGKSVVVVGAGRLVGMPAAHFARAEGASVTVVTKDTENLEESLRGADIVITGAGQPGLITPAMVKDGVVIFDAGTSEDGGVLRGDVAAAVAEKALIFTPVPGGIGPVTVAALLHNTVTLAARAWQGVA